MIKIGDVQICAVHLDKERYIKIPGEVAYIHPQQRFARMKFNYRKTLHEDRAGYFYECYPIISGTIISGESAKCYTELDPNAPFAFD